MEINRLKIICEEQKISVNELAVNIEVTPSLLYMVISGERNISKKIAKKIEDVYNYSYNWVLYGDGPRFVDNKLSTNAINDSKDHFDLKLYRMNKRLSQKEFAEALGITQGYLSELESHKKEISDAIKYKIIELYGEDISTVRIVQESAAKYNANKVGVPFYEVDVSASEIEMFKDKHEIPTAKYIVPGFEDCDFAVPVFGHSMYPTYENGSIIMCKKINDKSLIVFGEAYLIVTRDYRMVKRLQKTDNIGSVLACSDNEEERTKTGKKKFEPVEVPIDKILHLYLVKGVIKRNQL